MSTWIKLDFNFDLPCAVFTMGRKTQLLVQRITELGDSAPDQIEAMFREAILAARPDYEPETEQASWRSKPSQL